MATSVAAGLNFSASALCTHENAYRVDEADPTYTSDGYTGDLYCPDCDTIIEYGTIIPMLIENGWVHLEDGNWMYYKDGCVVYNWQEIDGVWYFFDGSGIMLTGWQEIDGNWYYFKSSGAMVTDWVKIDGSWYYFDGSGVMQKGWLQLDDNWYYLKPGGAMVTGWRSIGGKSYYFNNSGVMQTSWVKVDGKWYYLDNNGAAVSGWKKIGKAWFYFNKYAMRTGWQKIDGAWYYMNANGRMQTGWTKVSGKWYYLGKNGKMQTGWLKLGGKWYYLNTNGSMQTGWKTIGGKSYYFDYNGVWRKGFYNEYASYGSDYVNNYNRTQNLRIASSYIDGTILQPGEIFDFNAIVGPRTSARGYLPAPVFTGPTTHADEVGGGICQVSSTIFNAALYANFEIVERHQHTQRVYYVPFGRDAAMYQNVNNFRFRNTSGKTIKIHMTVENGTITCTFYTAEYVKPPKVTLDVTQSGNTFTLRRYVNGVCNYTTTSTY